MKFPFILSRIALVAALSAIPLLIWPTPIWLAALCWISAGLIYRFGMYDPEMRLQRLIVKLALGCFVLVALPGAVEIPPEWIPDPDLRKMINTLLAVLLRTTTNPVFVVLLGVILVTVCALEAWRLYLKHHKPAPCLTLMAVQGHAVIGYSHDEGCHVVEQRAVVTNTSASGVAIQAVRMTSMMGADLETDVYIVGEATYTLGPDKSFDIAAGADRVMHVMAQPRQAWLRWVLAVLDRPALRALPLPFALIVRDAHLPFRARFDRPDTSSR